MFDLSRFENIFLEVIKRVSIVAVLLFTVSILSMNFIVGCSKINSDDNITKTTVIEDMNRTIVVKETLQYIKDKNITSPVIWKDNSVSKKDIKKKEVVKKISKKIKKKKRVKKIVIVKNSDDIDDIWNSYNDIVATI